MVKIELDIDKELNFLMIIYQKIKNQNNFDNISFVDFCFDEKDKKVIKEIIIKNRGFKECLRQNNKLNSFYQKNKEIFERYWSSNKEKLIEIKRIMDQKIANFDLSIFEKIGVFFNFAGPSEVNLYICLGNESLAGTGNAFSPNFAVIFPRRFNNYSKETLDADFGVLIHEVFHLFQNMCSEKDKEFREYVARCFAPKGILFNEEKFDEDIYFYKILKDSFEDNKNYNQIRDYLIERFHALQKKI